VNRAPNVICARRFEAIAGSVILVVMTIAVFGVWMVPGIVGGAGGCMVVYRRHGGRAPRLDRSGLE
jgi:hypothetical protein